MAQRKNRKPTQKKSAPKNPLQSKIPRKNVEKVVTELKEEAVRPFTFVDSHGKKRILTALQYKFCLEYLSNKGNGTQAIIDAGYNIYYPKSTAVNYNLAKVMAHENLTKPYICDFITSKLREYGFDDENVELQHLAVINQHADLGSKMKAIDTYYKLKNKYPAEKHEHTVAIVETVNYGDPK